VLNNYLPHIEIILSVGIWSWGKISLDYLGDPNVIIRVLMRENQESLCQRKEI